MKASRKQILVFDKTFDHEWRKLFVHLMERKNIVITDLLPNHDLKSAVSPTETKFFEDLGKDAFHYWARGYYEDNKTEMLRSDDDIMRQISQILKKSATTQNRPVEELFVEKYYGLKGEFTDRLKINTDYGDLVNLLTMFKEEMQSR
jgi:hypothetical protein